MSPHLLARAAHLWPSLPVRKILHLTEGEECVVVGTLSKDLKLRPNVLETYATDRRLQSAIFDARFSSPQDTLALEDEGARMTIRGACVSPRALCTGVIVALRGADCEGTFEVTDVIFPSVLDPPPLSHAPSVAVPRSPLPLPPAGPDTARAPLVLLVSGLGLSRPAAHLSAQLLADWVTGAVGGERDRALASRVVRIVIAGGLVARAASSDAMASTSSSPPPFPSSSTTNLSSRARPRHPHPEERVAATRSGASSSAFVTHLARAIEARDAERAQDAAGQDDDDHDDDEGGGGGGGEGGTVMRNGERTTTTTRSNRTRGMTTTTTTTSRPPVFLDATTKVDEEEVVEDAVDRPYGRGVQNPVRPADVAALRRADAWLTELASRVPVDVMPGPGDPTTSALPQQPFHPCLLPGASGHESTRSGGEAGAPSRFVRATNPHEAKVHGVHLLGTSGQNVRDLWRCTEVDDPLALACATLAFGHVAPTAPDTLPCYPYKSADPFVLDACPHVLFVGGQSAYDTALVTGTEGRQTRVVLVPRFDRSGQVVLLDLESLDTYPMQFGTRLMD